MAMYALSVSRPTGPCEAANLPQSLFDLDDLDR